MSRVVLARECRICACASSTSAPAIFSQVACDVRKHHQFTHGIPSARPAGLRNLDRMLLSQIGNPFWTGGVLAFAHRPVITPPVRLWSSSSPSVQRSELSQQGRPDTNMITARSAWHRSGNCLFSANADENRGGRRGGETTLRFGSCGGEDFRRLRHVRGRPKAPPRANGCPTRRKRLQVLCASAKIGISLGCILDISGLIAVLNNLGLKGVLAW